MKNHLSPFRYPGGKSWFLKHVRRWLKAQTNKPKLLIEPFGGGAGISLTAVHEKLVERAMFAEIDQDVAATWRAVLNGHATWLANKVLSFRVSRDGVERILQAKPRTDYERAFQCLLRNRTARGGVLSAGAGLIRHGEDGKGITSRWYPKTLARRIETIASLKAQLRFCQRDAFEVIARYIDHSDTVLEF
jgi:DNA adenine methylase